MTQKIMNQNYVKETLEGRLYPIFFNNARIMVEYLEND